MYLVSGYKWNNKFKTNVTNKFSLIDEKWYDGFNIPKPLFHPKSAVDSNESFAVIIGWSRLDDSTKLIIFSTEDYKVNFLHLHHTLFYTVQNLVWNLEGDF